MSINVIKDAVKSLAQSLQLTMIFPAALLVFVNGYVIIPYLLRGLDIPYDTSTPIALASFVSITLLLSYSLYAFNFPLIRLLEGYQLKEADFFYDRLLRKQQEFNAIKYRLDLYETQIIEEQAFIASVGDEGLLDDDVLQHREKLDMLYARWAELQRHFDMAFPSTLPQVRPTRLGNTIAAFEDYPRTRYGMDTIALWARMIPLLQDKHYLEFVTQEKAVFDFFLNMLVVIPILGLEAAYIALFYENWGILFSVLVMGIVITWVVYRGILIAARQWGGTVRVAFDLYRRDLGERLGLRQASSFHLERERWEALSAFILYRHRNAAFHHFVSQTEYAQRSAQS
jgi:hypothetical protein